MYCYVICQLLSDHNNPLRSPSEEGPLCQRQWWLSEGGLGTCLLTDEVADLLDVSAPSSGRRFLGAPLPSKMGSALVRDLWQGEVKLPS